MPYDLKTIPLSPQAYAAVVEIQEAFYAGGGDLGSSKLAECEARHGLQFAEAMDALSNHLVCERENDANLHPPVKLD
jgi:hypothetical protein